MAGFALQSQLFLLHFFSGIGDGRREPTELAEMERLSDILVPNSDRLSLVQVKRTLDKRALIASLKEAYLITEMCCDELPEALDRLSFQIACRRRTTQLTPAQISPLDVVDIEYDADIWTRMLEHFHETPIIEQSDHSGQLYLLLWNAGLLDPMMLITDCLGQLLNAAEDPDHRSEPLARDLASRYHSAPRQERWDVLGQVLTTNDISPDPDADALHGVLAGQCVTLEHLRKGYVKPRPEIFNSLWSVFDIWRNSVETVDDEITESIPVFWVAGRSGDGKSVLLLQLVQRMLQQDPDLPIVHLPSGNRLPEFLENAPLIEQVTPVVVIDDVYDLNDRDAWEERIRESCKLGTPGVMLVTCGPTEQYDQFRANLSDLFKLSRFVTPQLEAQEQDKFVAWYEQRTGQHRDRQALTTQNVLLVQALFELVQGRRMPLFARTLARRLGRLGLFTAVRTIVAINALYEDAPVELLGDERQRRALERLCAKDQLHFQINMDAFGAPRGVRLAHTHLTWLLFQEWADTDGVATIEQAWAAELHRGLTCHLERKRHVDAGSLLHQHLTSARLRDEPEGEPNRIATIREVYRLHVAHNGGTPHIAVLPRWLNLVYRLPALTLTPDPAEVAVRMLANVEDYPSVHGSVAGWTWRIAATRDPVDGNRLRNATKKFFMEHPESPGIVSALSKVGALPSEAGHALLLDWLHHYYAHPQAYQLIAPLVTKRGEEQGICDLAIHWLASHPEHPQAYWLIAPLVTKRGEEQQICDLAIQWLANHQEHPQAYHVIAPLVAKRGDEQGICDLAIHWLANHQEHPQAYQLIAPLVTKRGEEQGICDLAIQWLANHPEHPTAYHVIAPLVTKRGEEQQICDLAIHWLANHPEHPQAYHVIAPLVTKRGEEQQICDLAIHWLEDHLENANIWCLLENLVGNRKGDNKVVSLARGWLDNNLSHPRAAQVLIPLASYTNDRPEIRDYICSWLTSNPDDPRYSNVLGALTASSNGDKKIHALAEAYLQRCSSISKAEIIGALLYSDHASRNYVDLALAFISEFRGQTVADVLLVRLGNALAHNPKALIEHLSGGFSDQHMRALSICAAYGLKRNPKLINSFFDSVADGFPSEYLGVLLGKALDLEITNEIVYGRIAHWLKVNYRCRGYGRMVGKISAHPEIWTSVKQGNKLRAEIFRDVENSAPVRDGDESDLIRLLGENSTQHRGALAEALSAVLRKNDSRGE